MARSALHIGTWEYEKSHGARPRGAGNWAFCPASKVRLLNYLDYVKWAPYGTLGEAKRWLRAQGAAGAWEVCP